VIDLRIAITAVLRSPAHGVAAIAVIAMGLTPTTPMAAELNAAFRSVGLRSKASNRSAVTSGTRRSPNPVPLM
jgi:hypothetical protein